MKSNNIQEDNTVLLFKKKEDINNQLKSGVETKNTKVYRIIRPFVYSIGILVIFLFGLAMGAFINFDIENKKSILYAGIKNYINLEDINNLKTEVGRLKYKVNQLEKENETFKIAFQYNQSKIKTLTLSLEKATIINTENSRKLLEYNQNNLNSQKELQLFKQSVESKLSKLKQQRHSIKRKLKKKTKSIIKKAQTKKISRQKSPSPINQVFSGWLFAGASEKMIVLMSPDINEPMKTVEIGETFNGVTVKRIYLDKKEIDSSVGRLTF